MGGAKEYYISGCHVFVLFETQQYGDSYVKAGFPLGIISGNGQESFLCLASSRSVGPNGSNTKETFLSVPVLSVFLSGNTRKRFPAFLYWLLFSRESRTTSSLLETKQKRRKTFPCVRGLKHVKEADYRKLTTVFHASFMTSKMLMQF